MFVEQTLLCIQESNADEFNLASQITSLSNPISDRSRVEFLGFSVDRVEFLGFSVVKIAQKFKSQRNEKLNFLLKGPATIKFWEMKL